MARTGILVLFLILEAILSSFHCWVWCWLWVCHLCVLSWFSSVWLFATLWIVAFQALSIRFSRQEYWSGLSYPLPGDLPYPGIKPASLTSPALAGGFFTSSTTWKAHRFVIYDLYYVEVWSFNNHSVENFYHHKRMLNYVKKFFCSWDDYIILFFSLLIWYIILIDL